MVLDQVWMVCCAFTPSATMATHFEDLCKYVGLPADLSLLFDAVEGNSLEGGTASPLIAAVARK